MEKQNVNLPVPTPDTAMKFDFNRSPLLCGIAFIRLMFAPSQQGVNTKAPTTLCGGSLLNKESRYLISFANYEQYRDSINILIS